jgi:hypothetical protein
MAMHPREKQHNLDAIALMLNAFAAGRPRNHTIRGRPVHEHACHLTACDMPIWFHSSM